MIKKAFAVFAILLTVSAQAQSRICANKTTGNILIRSTCYSTETTISNIASLKGPKGDTGPQGIQGVPGAKGATGAQGIQGPPGTNVDMTKCRAADLTRDVQAPNEAATFNSTLSCNSDGENTPADPKLFLFSYSWDSYQGSLPLEGKFTLQKYHSSPNDINSPLTSVSYGYTTDNPSEFYTYQDPHGSGVCCPLPQVNP